MLPAVGGCGGCAVDAHGGGGADAVAVPPVAWSPAPAESWFAGGCPACSPGCTPHSDAGQILQNG